MTPKTVFITGAAAGIGRAVALRFAAKGYTVGGYDITETGLESLAAEITALGATSHTGHLDVTDADEMTTRVDEFVVQAGGRLDVMVNNAGVLVDGKFAELSVAAQRKLIDVNCGGVVNGSHAAYPHLKATPGSVLVNLASASAIYGQAELAVYSSTKFFVRAMTEALDLEWGPDGIRVIDMWPLFVRSAMTADISTGTSSTLGIKLTPDDVADAVMHALEPSWVQRRIRQVHFPVGTETKVFAALSRFSPSWVLRLVNKRLSHL